MSVGAAHDASAGCSSNVFFQKGNGMARNGSNYTERLLELNTDELLDSHRKDDGFNMHYPRAYGALSALFESLQSEVKHLRRRLAELEERR